MNSEGQSKHIENETIGVIHRPVSRRENVILTGTDSSTPFHSPSSPTDDTESTSLIEQITMECMMNKKHYKKYLAKTDITRFQELQEKMNRIKQVRDDITEMTQEMLDDIIKCCGESSKYNTKIQSTFDAYLNACMEYINTTKISPEHEHEDENMLFPPTSSIYVAPINHSYWGKSIRKMK